MYCIIVLFVQGFHLRSVDPSEYNITVDGEVCYNVEVLENNVRVIIIIMSSL